MEELKTKIILAGYRATGKSSVGILLAKELGLNFIDMDEEIERRAGEPIKEMVAEKGWDSFRSMERDLLYELVCQKDLVISTGGGAILHEKIWEQMQHSGVVVWLTAELDVICERLSADKKSDGQRPSLTGQDILVEVASILAEREPLYKKGSHLTVDTGKKDVDEIVAEIKRALNSPEFMKKVEASIPEPPVYC